MNVDLDLQKKINELFNGQAGVAIVMSVKWGMYWQQSVNHHMTKSIVRGNPGHKGRGTELSSIDLKPPILPIHTTDLANNSSQGSPN